MESMIKNWKSLIRKAKYWPRNLTKKSLVDEIWNFWWNLKFLMKFEIFDEIWNFWSNLKFLIKVGICDQIWNFFVKFELLDNTLVKLLATKIDSSWKVKCMQWVFENVSFNT